MVHKSMDPTDGTQQSFMTNALALAFSGSWWVLHVLRVVPLAQSRHYMYYISHSLSAAHGISTTTKLQHLLIVPPTSIAGD